MFDPGLLDVVRDVLGRCRARGVRLVTAESCTGGLLGGALTAVEGASEVMDRGFVTYSDEAKRELLGVPGTLLEGHGAVSSQVARAMAEGAMARSRGQLAISVTGIAGPGGGSADKPVGLVYVATCLLGADQPTACERLLLSGDRGEIRGAAVRRSLELLLARLGP